MRFFAGALLFFGAASFAQTPEVPHKMSFAGMTLSIRDDARREIQQDVDAFTKSPKYFNIKVERAKTYFPIIERIFQEERLPVDFKYLVLQESALVPDAVSVSNAVGFWQFKDYTAREMGLRVDDEIDERMNIVAASRGAAKYLKQSNFYFNNWIYALQAYQMGAGAVQRSVGEEHHGVTRMEITSDTYWYVKKYLAYKVAYENVLEGEPQVKIKEHVLNQPTSVKDLVRKIEVEETTLREFNRWIKGESVPADRPYVLIIPSGAVISDFDKLVVAAPTERKSTIALNPIKEVTPERLEINGVWAVKANHQETLIQLANRLKVPLSTFLRYNDITIDHQPEGDRYYFVERKKKKGYQHAYTAQQEDSFWSISQKFAVELKRVKRYNPGKTAISAGDVVWLATAKPAKEIDDVVELQQTTFNWDAKPNETSKGNGGSEKPEATQENMISDGHFHEVKPADTLYSVAKQYNVTVKELMDWNNKADFSLSVGEKLKVKGK